VVLFHGEFEVGEDFGFGLLGEFCAFCCYVLLLELFEDWFAYSCLVDERFAEMEFLVCAGYCGDYFGVGGF